MFARLKPLINATDGLTLGQVCAITGLEASTIQNWVKRGFVARPVKKKYRERQLARILLIASLRECMKIESIGALMTLVNGNADDESDDIISEEALYDYLCNMIAKSSDTVPRIEDVPALVTAIMQDYNAPDAAAKEKLQKALTVMVYAYTASEYKQRADKLLTQMKENG